MDAFKRFIEKIFGKNINNNKPKKTINEDQKNYKQSTVVNCTDSNFDDFLEVVYEASTPIKLQFTYLNEDTSRERIKVYARKIFETSDNEYIIKGLCLNSNEEKEFKSSNIVTKLVVPGFKKRLELEEWLDKVLMMAD